MRISDWSSDVCSSDLSREARVATLGHLEGVCHSYIHCSADPDMAVEVVLNAKMRRVSICGATETLLIDRAIAPALSSEERRVGKEGVSTCRSRWPPNH